MPIRTLNNWPVYCAGVLILTGMAWLLPATYGYAVKTDAGGDDSVSGELSRVHATVFDSQGSEMYYLESRRLNYVEDQALLEPVQLVYVSDDDGKIFLQAGSGYISDNGNFAILDGEVEIKQVFADRDLTETASTSDVRVNMEEHFAKTEAHTVIKRADHTVSGDGMEVDLKEGKMRLLNNVKVQYAQ